MSKRGSDEAEISMTKARKDHLIKYRTMTLRIVEKGAGANHG